MPEVKPPIAPASALNCEFEALTAHRSLSVSRVGSVIASSAADVAECAPCGDKFVDRDCDTWDSGSATPYSGGDAGAGCPWGESCWL